MSTRACVVERHFVQNILYFARPLKGFPLELGIVAEGQKTKMMGLPGRQRSLTISSAMWIQCTNVTDGRTDITDTGRQQRPRLRIASRGIKLFTDSAPITRFGTLFRNLTDLSVTECIQIYFGRNVANLRKFLFVTLLVAMSCNLGTTDS